MHAKKKIIFVIMAFLPISSLSANTTHGNYEIAQYNLRTISIAHKQSIKVKPVSMVELQTLCAQSILIFTGICEEALSGNYSIEETVHRLQYTGKPVLMKFFSQVADLSQAGSGMKIEEERIEKVVNYKAKFIKE